MRARTRFLLVLAAIVVVAVVGGIGLRALWSTTSSHFNAEDCTVGDYEISTDQAAVASTMVGAVTKYRLRLPERATVLVLAAGLQESKLTNIPPGEGDRDSVGVLQQRPSQGWGGGDAAKLTDVGEATTEFLDALVKVPNWQTMPLAEAVQAVQISADGSLYAQHEPEAKALADALQGHKPAGISCSFDEPTKVASSTTVATQAGEQLGITTPRAAGALTVRVPGAAWQTVAWFVANADRLGIEQVDYNQHRWTRSDGWKKSSSPGTAVVATLHDLKR
jgi:hypothetical protein